MILHYYEKGNKNDPTVVFIHGSASDASVWLKEINIMAARGYHCIALDLRGHGGTKDKKQPLEHARMDFETHLLDIKDTLRLLEILPEKNKPDPSKKFSVVTHSFGGILAVYLAEKFPDNIERLILACIPPKLIFPVKNLLGLLVGKPLDAIQNNLDLFAKIPIRKRYKSSITTNAHVLQEIYQHVKTWNGFNHASEVNCPVHIAAGRFDFVATAEDLKLFHNRFKHSTYELFKWSCHALMEDEPEHFEEWLITSLNGERDRLAELNSSSY